MSTTPSFLPAATQGPAIPVNPAAGLCAGQPAAAGSKLIDKILPNNNLSISLRPFDPAADTPIVYKWMSLEYEGPLKCKPHPPRALQESYACMMESDCAQPFMGLVNDVPVCQINVFKVAQDALSLTYDSHPGDYGIQLTLAPLAIQDNMVSLLLACLEYFFSYREAGRFVADIEIQNEWAHNLFTKTGFRMSKKIRTGYRVSHLLVCTRDSHQRAAEGPLLAKNI